LTENELTLVFFDLETTGLNVEVDEVIEVGAIKVKNNQIIKRFSTFVRPLHSIPQLVTNLTGITFEDVEKAPDKEIVRKHIKEFIGNYPLIAHNVSFDRLFLEKLMEEKLENEFFDTLELSRLFFPSLASHSLQNLVKALPIEKSKAHRALSDTMMLYSLFQQIVNEREKTDPYLLHKLKEISRGVKNYDLIFGENWERGEEKETSFIWKEREIFAEAELPFGHPEREGIDKYLNGISFLETPVDDNLLQSAIYTSFRKPLIISTYSDLERQKITSMFRKEGVKVESFDNLNMFACPDKINYLLNNIHLIPQYFRMYFAMLVSYLYKTNDFFLANAPVYIQKNALLRLLSFCDKDWESCKYRDVCPLHAVVNAANASQVVTVNHSFFFNKQNYRYSFMKRNVIFLDAFRLPKVFSLSKVGFSLNDLKFFAFYYEFPREKVKEIEYIFGNIGTLSIREEVPIDMVKALRDLFLDVNNVLIENFFNGNYFWVEKRRGKPLIFSAYGDAHVFFHKIREVADSVVFISPEFSINGRDNIVSDFSGLKGKKFKLTEAQYERKKILSIVPIFLSSPNRDSFINEFTYFFGRIHRKGEKSLILFSSLDILRKMYFSLKSKGLDVKAHGIDLKEEEAEIQMMLYNVVPADNRWSEIYFVKMPTFFSPLQLEREEYLTVSSFMLKNISIKLLQNSPYCIVFYIDGRLKSTHFREGVNNMFVSFPLFLDKPNSLYLMIDRWRARNKINY